jgi:uncharacterized membrane protein YeiB
LAKTIALEKKRDRDFKNQQRKQILYGLCCLVILATQVRRDNPLLANAGLIVMLLCMALMLAGSIILKYRQRESHPWLPVEKYFAEQRKKVYDRIALWRRNTRWLLIPCMAGFLTWQIVLSHSLQMKIALVCIGVIVSAGLYGLYRRKLQKEFLPELEAIERDFEDEQKNGGTFPWSD